MRATVHHQILHMTREKLNRNVSYTMTILLFPSCTQNLIVYHCSCEHSLSSITKYTPKVAQTHFILTAVAQGHTNLILCNSHKRWTIYYCFDSCIFTLALPLCAAQSVSLYWPALIFTFEDKLSALYNVAYCPFLGGTFLFSYSFEL